ncbi:MAG: hypothetical protein Q9195_003066 [Heterodermia aff. obscurata]
MSTKRPALALETLEHHIDRIECSNDRVVLDFATSEALNEVHRHIDGSNDFLLITSHQSCDLEGERNVRLVSNIAADVFAYRIEMFATQISWKDGYRSMKVDFGASTQELSLRKHNELRKRQQTTISATVSPSAAFPVLPSSSPTPTIHEVTENIDLSYHDTTILPPNFPGVDSVTLHAPFVPHGITFGCKNCTAKGNIELSQGTFTLSTNDSDESVFKRGVVNTTENIVHFIEDGIVEFNVLDFAAHIELESNVTLSKTLKTFHIPFPNITLTPWQIPGVASVGPIFSPNLVLGAKLASDLSFTYGFDLTIPNNSSIVLNIGNLTQSNMTGFGDTTITALPFQAAVNDIALTLSAAFTPELLMGISVFDGAGTVGAGAFLDLPKISATVAQVANVNSKCEPEAVPANNDTGLGGALDDFFNSLTHLTSEVELAVGVVAEEEVHAGVLFTQVAVTSYTAFSTDFPLPTACFSFDAAAKTFGSPTTSNSASGTPGASAIPGGTKSAASLGKDNALGGVVGKWGRFETTFAILLRYTSQTPESLHVSCRNNYSGLSSAGDEDPDA